MQTYPPGTRIGQYEIASLPMMGGMGVVYFALDHGNDGRPVALKTFRPELLPDRAARDRFLREGTAWIELGSHPHIVRCYKVEYTDPTAFLVLELIAKEQNMPNASLRSWLIPGQPLPIEQALLFALQIARGMQFATEKIPGFIHRDLKPENILVGVDRLPNTNINRLRVTDFGLVKTIVESGISIPISNSEELRPNQIQFTRGVGTPLYMAPEQWKGEPVGVFTDVYAFGCILFEMLSGRPVARGRTIAELKASHCDGNLRFIKSNVSDEVASLITRCLSFNPIARYRSWREVVNELELNLPQDFGKLVTPLDDTIELDREEQVQVGSSYNAIGLAYIDIGNPQEAIQYFLRALDIARDTNNQNGECVSLSNLGKTYALMDNKHKAVLNYEQSLEMARRLGDKYSEGGILNNLGHIHRDNGDIQQAISCYEKSLGIARELGSEQATGATLVSLGVAHLILGNPQQAISYYERYLLIAQANGDRRGMGQVLGNLGNAYLSLGDTKRAIDFYERGIDIAREIGNRRGEGSALANMGNVCFKIGDFKKAIECFEGALSVDRETGDRQGESGDLGSLGNIYKELGSTQQAIDFYQRAITIAKEINDADAIASFSFNAALTYIQQSSPSKALLLAEKAAQIWSQMGSPHAEAALRVVSNLQDNNTPDDEPPSIDQEVFEYFLEADSFQSMQQILKEHPVLKEVRFIQMIEQVIKEQVPLEHKDSVEMRLNWLKQIAKK